MSKAFTTDAKCCYYSIFNLQLVQSQSSTHASSQPSMNTVMHLCSSHHQCTQNPQMLPGAHNSLIVQCCHYVPCHVLCLSLSHQLPRTCIHRPACADKQQPARVPVCCPAFNCLLPEEASLHHTTQSGAYVTNHLITQNNAIAAQPLRSAASHTMHHKQDLQDSGEAQRLIVCHPQSLHLRRSSP